MEQFPNKYGDLKVENIKLKSNWAKLKEELVDYRFKKIGSNDDRRYCVALSITEILDLMEDIEKGKK